MKLIKAVAILATASFLVACAQPEPEVIQPEPTYDKYGNVVS
jgi:putative hemolysin